MHDADDDGHPLFGHTVARLGVEDHQGRSFVAESTSIDFADFDRDGRVDVIATNVRPHSLSNQEYYLTVLRGHGDGVFDTPPAIYMAGNEATDVVAADLNGDGWPDAATANGFGNSVSVHLNGRDGTLLERVDYPAGQQPRSLRVADLDGDGDRDIACLNCLSHDVSVLLNRGDGTFDPQVRTFVGNVTQRGLSNLNFAYPGPFLAVGDFDQDQDIDIAIPAGLRVKLLLNDGHGSLSLAPAALLVPGGSYALVVADFNRDQKADIASTVLDKGSAAAVYLGLGAGQFSPAAVYDTSNLPEPCPACLFSATTITAGDLEGNGYPDLAVGHETWWPAVVVLRNRGDGTFAPKELYDSYEEPRVVRLADVNADGRADLSVIHTALRGYLGVMLSDIAARPMTYARFPPWNPRATGGTEGRQALAAADLDRDGDQDLVVGMQNPLFPGHVRVIRNDGGVLVDLPAIALGPTGQASSEDVALGDLNGDGRLDIIVADAVVPGGFTDPGKVWVLLNQGSLAFAIQPPFPLDSQYPKAVALGDLDQDGDLDLAVWTTAVYPGNDITPVERRLLRFLNNGDGSFAPAGAAVIDTAPWYPRGDVAVGDLNGDKRPDIVASSGPRPPAMGTMAVQLSLGQGAFAAPVLYTIAGRAQGLGLVDLNNDSTTDIAIAHYEFGTPDGVYLTKLLGNGFGAFPARTELIDRSFLTQGSLAVFAHAAPGHPRIVLAASFGTIQVRSDDPSGSQLERTSFADTAANHSEGIVITDLDGDGRPDIARVVMGAGDGTVVLFNKSRHLPCYPNCAGLNAPPALDVLDFMCFLNAFAAGDPYANCDGSTAAPLLTAGDFVCFQGRFAAGCR